MLIQNRTHLARRIRLKQAAKDRHWVASPKPNYALLKAAKGNTKLTDFMEEKNDTTN